MYIIHIIYDTIEAENSEGIAGSEGDEATGAELLIRKNLLVVGVRDPLGTIAAPIRFHNNI